jgi:hypothetical protein
MGWADDSNTGPVTRVSTEDILRDLVGIPNVNLFYGHNGKQLVLELRQATSPSRCSEESGFSGNGTGMGTSVLTASASAQE